MSMNRLIAPQTGGAQSAKIVVRSRSPKAIYAVGLAGAETASVQFTHDGTNWTNYYSKDEQVQLTATNNAIKLEGPGVFRINKGVTVGNVGIYEANDSSVQG